MYALAHQNIAQYFGTVHHQRKKPLTFCSVEHNFFSNDKILIQNVCKDFRNERVITKEEDILYNLKEELRKDYVKTNDN